MAIPAAASLLRPGLLDGRVVIVSGQGAYAGAARDACGELGAEVSALDADPLEEDAVAAAVSAAAGRSPDALVVDAAAHFAGAPQEGDAPLRSAADAAWIAARAVAAAWIPEEAGGKVVLLAPSPATGGHARATRAALENLARTSSIEWARYRIRPTAVLPGDDTPAEAVGGLVAYLVSEAGDYFSGCAFSLDGPVPVA
jgi:NAD(P)-dependent dehydrogenase (short-subunit alcohol dehydrogenase family)